MMYKLYAAFLMCLGVALTVASSQASGGARAGHGGVSASMHSRLSIGRSLDRTTTDDAIEALSFREISFGDRMTNPTENSRRRYRARAQTI